MEQKGCEWIIHVHDCYLWIAMMGRMDVADSDLDDFRRRRAIDISSYRPNSGIKPITENNEEFVGFYKWVTTTLNYLNELSGLSSWILM